MQTGKDDECGGVSVAILYCGKGYGCARTQLYGRRRSKAAISMISARAGQATALFTGFRLGTNYTVYVKDAVGCKNDTTIVTPTYPIKVPNFFTPDGDADNETFTITNIENIRTQSSVCMTGLESCCWRRKARRTHRGMANYNGHDMPSTDYWYEIYTFMRSIRPIRATLR